MSERHVEPLVGAGKREQRARIAYTAGAVVYARRRPDPVPAVFGYHELFHVLTILAVACQYVAIVVFAVGIVGLIRLSH